MGIVGARTGNNQSALEPRRGQPLSTRPMILVGQVQVGGEGETQVKECVVTSGASGL